MLNNNLLVPASGLALILILAAMQSAAAQLNTTEEIRDCARANSPEKTSMQFIELESHDRAGRKKKMDAQLRWKKHDDGHVRLMIRVMGPQDLKGSSYLVIENQNKPRDTVYVYLPALARARRIVGGGSKKIWGTDFSYEDLRLLQMKDTASDDQRLDDAEVAGRPTYVLSQVPHADQESAYERIVSFVDKKTCVAIKTEYYESGDRLRKRLLVDPETVAQVNGLWTAHDLEMKDIREETMSWLRVEKITYDEDMSSRYFNTVQFWGN